MFNFYVVLTGHNMLTDIDRAIMWRRKFKASSLQTTGAKNEVPSKTWVLTENNFKIQTKKKYTSSFDQTTPWNTWPLSARIDDGLCNQKKNELKKNWKKHSD